jgi:hypothetical protein
METSGAFEGVDIDEEAWFLSVSENDQDGPFSLKGLAERWQDDYNETAWLWRDCMSEWLQLAALPHVVAALGTVLDQQQSSSSALPDAADPEIEHKEATAATAAQSEEAVVSDGPQSQPMTTTSSEAAEPERRNESQDRSGDLKNIDNASQGVPESQAEPGSASSRSSGTLSLFCTGNPN